MANITQVEVNGTTYDICDATARDSLSHIHLNDGITEIQPFQNTYNQYGLRGKDANGKGYAITFDKTVNEIRYGEREVGENGATIWRQRIETSTNGSHPYQMHIQDSNGHYTTSFANDGIYLYDGASQRDLWKIETPFKGETRTLALPSGATGGQLSIAGNSTGRLFSIYGWFDFATTTTTSTVFTVSLPSEFPTIPNQVGISMGTPCGQANSLGLIYGGLELLTNKTIQLYCPFIGINHIYMQMIPYSF